MKKYLILLVVFLLTIELNAQKANSDFPNYNEIVNNFFSEYSSMQYSGNCVFVFKKKPTGWFIELQDIKDEISYTKDELYWDRKSHKYKKLSFKKIGDEIVDFVAIEGYLNDYSSKYFQICHYYGYVGWDWDVIQEFKEKTDLDDSTLYALGRAYSSFASNLLNSNSGLADSTKLFNLENRKNCMSSDQLKTYRYYRHLAIKKYEELAQRNPNFETIVGKIGIKASNEYMTSFLDLQTYQSEEEALKELKSNLYNDFFIATAKNYLSSCAPNAILFTNGDNDTYPLLYVQSMMNYRTDVAVVNMSLLMTNRYINRFRDSIFTSPGLPITFTPEQIDGNKRNIIVILSQYEKPIEVSELIEFIKNDANTQNYGEVNYFYSPTNSFRISTDNSEMQWSFDGNYFYLDKLILLDIMAKNEWKRPLYFAISMGDFFGLKTFIKAEGLALRVSSESSEIAENQSFNLNTDIMYKNMMLGFDWSGLDNLQFVDRYFCFNYRILLSSLATQLIKENKSDSALKVLNKSMELITNAHIEFDYTMFVTLDCYYQLKEYEKANSIAHQIIQNQKNEFLNPQIYNDLEYIESVTRNLEMLKEIAKKYNQQEIVEEIEKLNTGN